MTIAMLLQNTLSSFLKLLCALFLFASCEKKDPCTYFEGEAMQMPYRIVIGQTLSCKEKKSVADLIEETFLEVESRLNHRNPYSEISQLNRANEKALIPLSLPLQKLLAFCDQIVSLSGGRFDPTIGPLAALWEKENPPSSASLQTACNAVGWHHLSIHNGILKKECTETKLDLSALAKGVGIDWIVESLQRLGIKNLMVEWAGKYRALGHHPAQRDWLVQIHPALTIDTKSMAPIPIRNAALATSGNPFFKMIDPFTASPPEKTSYSVAFSTVIAPTCALASSLAATTLLFSTRKEAEHWAQEVVELYPDVRFWILSYR